MHEKKKVFKLKNKLSKKPYLPLIFRFLSILFYFKHGSVFNDMCTADEKLLRTDAFHISKFTRLV